MIKRVGSRFSLRSMLLLPLLAVLAVGYGAFALYVEQSVRADLLGTVDDELARVAGVPPQGRNQNQPSDGAAVPIQALFSLDGTEVIDAGNAPPAILAELADAGLEAGTTTLTIDGTELRVLVRPAPGNALELSALEIGSVLDSIDDLRRNLILGGIVIFATQAVLVWVLTSRATKPVTQLAETARRVTAGDHDIDIEVAVGPRETEQLAHDLDLMLRELRAALADQAASAATAEQARETMARFLADAAHELRTPLTALRGYTELYERDMLDEPGALDRAMSRIGTESERLERLVASLLELARGTTASVRDHGRVDVSSIVADVVDDIRAAHPERFVSVDVDPDLVVEGDHEQLHQAILNLAANACRHTTPPATIDIAARRTDDSITITVVDNGPGVAVEHRERIFDPFFQADDARTNIEGSAGLGLALTAQLLQSHRGQVVLRDTPGGGATFVLQLPAAVAR